MEGIELSDIDEDIIIDKKDYPLFMLCGLFGITINQL